MTPELVSLKQACELTSLSRTMINRLRCEGKFPEAVALGDKRIGFVVAEVREWVRARIHARDTQAAEKAGRAQ